MRPLQKAHLFCLFEPFRRGLAGVFTINVLLHNTSDLKLQGTK